ncbi:MAG TPA: acyl-CoA desaturase [Acidimicrobiia bacterium]
MVLGIVLFYGRMLAITAGYHRYFAHRSYKLARFPQFLLAFAGTMAAQKGPLWWAGHHRTHHKFTDEPGDPHTPKQGVFWSHIGWIMCDKYGPTDQDAIKDFVRYRELRFLDRHDWIGPWTLGIASYLIAGWSGLLIGFFGSTVLLWHTTFSVNSVAHIFGRRRYQTTDTSRNSFVLALVTGGEGWHNNHHHYAASARQGFFWWEIDTTYYVLKVFAWLGIVKKLKTPPPRARFAHRAGTN